MNSIFTTSNCTFCGTKRIDFTSADGRHVTGYHINFEDSQDNELTLFVNDSTFESLALPDTRSTGTLYVRIKDGYKGSKKIEFKRFEVTT